MQNTSVIHSIHLYRTPAEWLFDYDRFKHQDPIYPMLVAHPGKALSFNADEAFVHPALRQSMSQDTQARHLGKKIVVRIERARDSVFLSARKRVPADELSPRQIEIAQRVADGETYKEIARHLGITPATARNHIAAIYERLDISNKAELITQLALAD